MYPTITVIVPAYNVEDYIDDAIDSLLSQTVHFDEIIIIDDGSEDNTLKLLERFSENKCVKVIAQNNQGQGLARNRGVEESKSEYLYFFDSDDLLASNACELMKSNLSGHNRPDIFLFEGKSFKDSSVTSKRFNPSYSRPFFGYFDSQDEFFSKINRTKDLSCSPCLYVSKRSLWLDNHLRFNKYYHEDEEVFYKLLLYSKSYLLKPLELFNRRIRAGSTMTISKNDKHVMGRREHMLTLFSLLNNESNSREVSKALRNRISRFAASYYVTCESANEIADSAIIKESLRTGYKLKLIVRLILIRLKMLLP